jgi:very-short-patch-repair endonuclease
VIELDGGQHADQIERDEIRTEYLKSKGFQVLRIWDHEVFKETDAIIENILKVLDAIPTTGSVRSEAYGWKA